MPFFRYDTSQRIGDWFLFIVFGAFFAVVISHG
jgi:hypothetical protein